mmetsp:Transcript_14136/g.34269  ORF Transcript_14136/g.34269 Transcript_14136/m.34269 type:complete len:215 (+) Transcript_14136:509-1153(+)
MTLDLSILSLLETKLRSIGPCLRICNLMSRYPFMPETHSGSTTRALPSTFCGIHLAPVMRLDPSLLAQLVEDLRLILSMTVKLIRLSHLPLITGTIVPSECSSMYLCFSHRHRQLHLCHHLPLARKPPLFFLHFPRPNLSQQIHLRALLTWLLKKLCSTGPFLMIYSPMIRYPFMQEGPSGSNTQEPILTSSVIHQEHVIALVRNWSVQLDKET